MNGGNEVRCVVLRVDVWSGGGWRVGEDGW